MTMSKAPSASTTNPQRSRRSSHRGHATSSSNIHNSVTSVVAMPVSQFENRQSSLAPITLYQEIHHVINYQARSDILMNDSSTRVMTSSSQERHQQQFVEINNYVDMMDTMHPTLATYESILSLCNY